MYNCKCSNKKEVYLISKNGLKMYFHQCSECGRTFDKFLSHSAIDIKTAVEYDSAKQDEYNKILKKLLKINEETFDSEGNVIKKVLTKQSKMDWHKANKPIALEIYEGKCGECGESTTIKEGLIHHYAYPAGVYLQDVKTLIEKKICIWICKDCHEDIHTPKDLEELENGFYKILGKCSLCMTKTAYGYQRAKEYNLNVECLCKFCANGTSQVLLQFYKQHIYESLSSDFKYMQLKEFIEQNLLSKAEKARRKVIGKVRKEAIIQKTDNNTYVFSESYTNYMRNLIDES